jgi:hypothetical protein
MIPPNPAELLGSKRFEEYVSTLGEHFDWVLVDSPPVLAVADAGGGGERRVGRRLRGRRRIRPAVRRAAKRFTSCSRRTRA